MSLVNVLPSESGAVAICARSASSGTFCNSNFCPLSCSKIPTASSTLKSSSPPQLYNRILCRRVVDTGHSEGSHVLYSYPRYFIFSFAINDCFGARMVEPQCRAEPYFHKIRGLKDRVGKIL